MTRSTRAGLTVIVLVGSLLGTAVPGLADVDDDPYVTVDHWDGIVHAGVRWHVAPAGLACEAVNVTIVGAVKTCGGYRFFDDEETNGEIRFLPAEHIETIVVELAWEPAQPLAAISLDVLCSDVPRSANGAVLDLDHPCYFQTVHGTTQQIRVDRAHWEQHGYTVLDYWAARVFAGDSTGLQEEYGIGAAYAYEQPFEIYVSLFYGEAAPEGYSAVPA